MSTLTYTSLSSVRNKEQQNNSMQEKRPLASSMILIQTLRHTQTSTKRKHKRHPSINPQVKFSRTNFIVQTLRTNKSARFQVETD